MKKQKHPIRLAFNKFSNIVSKATGHPVAFFIALGLVITWAACGPLLDFSETWQLTINTGTTIITFLMVFIIQQSQNRETMAMQLKLNELIAASNLASNRLVDIEDLTDSELEKLKGFYVKLAELSRKEQDLHATHSIDEAKAIHTEKLQKQKAVKHGGDAKQ